MSPMAPHRNHIPYEDPSEKASTLLEDAPSPRRQSLIQVGKLLGAFTFGLLLGVLLIPGPDASLQAQLQEAQTRVQAQKVTIKKLERSLSYQAPATKDGPRGAPRGSQRPQDGLARSPNGLPGASEGHQK